MNRNVASRPTVNEDDKQMRRRIQSARNIVSGLCEAIGILTSNKSIADLIENDCLAMIADGSGARDDDASTKVLNDLIVEITRTKSLRESQIQFSTAKEIESEMAMINTIDIHAMQQAVRMVVGPVSCQRVLEKADTIRDDLVGLTGVKPVTFNHAYKVANIRLTSDIEARQDHIDAYGEVDVDARVAELEQEIAKKRSELKANQVVSLQAYREA